MQVGLQVMSVSSGWGVVKGIVNELNSLAACVSTAAAFKARRIVEEEIRELRGKARLLCRGLIKEGGDENFFDFDWRERERGAKRKNVPLKAEPQIFQTKRF